MSKNKTENKQLAKRIKRALEDLGISYATIAREHGCSRNHVSLVAKSERSSEITRKAIAEKLGWNPWAEGPERRLAG